MKRVIFGLIVIIVGLVVDPRISEVQKTIGNTIHNPSPSESLAANILYIIGGISTAYGFVDLFRGNSQGK
jgi:hypothetical protein